MNQKPNHDLRGRPYADSLAVRAEKARDIVCRMTSERRTTRLSIPAGDLLHAEPCGDEDMYLCDTLRDLATAISAAEAAVAVRGLSFNALRSLNVPRVAAFGQTLDAWSPMEWACAAAGEMGELCNALKKRSRREDPKRPGHDITGKPIPTLRDVGDEIADVVIYLDLLGAALGIDMGEAVVRKWNEVSEKMGHAPRIDTTLRGDATSAKEAHRGD